MIRKDEIGFGGYVLLQDDSAFCYGVDAVLLADFCKAKEKDHCIDLGCASGVVPMIVYAKYHPAYICGLEIQKDIYELGLENIKLNNLSDVMKFDNGDVSCVSSIYEAESFDLVSCNPPYFEQGRGPESPNQKLNIARTEGDGGLEVFISAAAYLLKKGGRLCMVHRPSRLPDIIELGRKHRLEAKRLCLVAPHPGEAANIMLIELIKGAGKELKVLPTISVRSSDGEYSEEIKKIYRH